MHKKIAVLFFTLLHLTTGAMEKELTLTDKQKISDYCANSDIEPYNHVNSAIVTPYEPTFIKRNFSFLNKCLSIGAGAAVGLVKAVLTDQQDGDDKGKKLLMAGGVALATGSLLYIINKHHFTPKLTLLDALLLHPDKALKYADCVENECITNQKKYITDELEINEIKNRYKKIEASYAKLCPFFELGECTQEGFGECLLSRTYQPRTRELYEKKLVDMMLKKTINNPSKTLSYASFGVGGKFQDLVVLTKYLCKKPDACLDIHLLEGNHTPYVAVRDRMGNGRQVQVNQDTNPESVVPAMIKEIRERKEVLETESDEITTRRIHFSTIKIESSAQQFIGWLENTFPKAQLALYIHSMADSFVEYLDNNNMSYPDILTTADIEDEMSMLRTGPSTYIKLCIKNLQKNSSSSNIWLSKFNSQYTLDGKPHLLSIALDKLANAHEFELKEKEEKEGIKIYTTDSIYN